jgi:micrococcal nuclease
MNKKDYLYNAILVRIIDGDTIECDIDLGFQITQRMPVRLAHINAPEHNTPEGKLATLYIAGLLTHDLVLKTYKPHDKYGRYLAEVYLPDGTYVNELMISSGNAVAYEGGGK